MKRRISFWALVAVALALGVLFFHVIQPFLPPLFLAAVLALLAHPFHEWTARRLGGRRRAAAFVAAFLLLIGLVPVGIVLSIAGQELVAAGQALSQVKLEDQPAVQRLTTLTQRFFPEVGWQDMRDSIVRAIETTTQSIFDQTQEFVSGFLAFAVGLAVMGLALYYFLAEGPSMIQRLHRLSPLDGGEEDLLFDKFGRVCRGLVLGTLVCAVAQAVLLGIGLWIAGVGGVWALAGLTLIVSMVPYIGSAGVWIPVTGWLLWQGRYGAALFLGLYGGAVVSTSDNLIRAHVLHGSARIHPLLALVSALGGMQLVGMWGIFLGPIVAALFSTLIQVLHERLESEISDSELGEMTK